MIEHFIHHPFELSDEFLLSLFYSVLMPYSVVLIKLYH